MLNRKVNLRLLTINTLVYRLWIIIENGMFLWLIGALFIWLNWTVVGLKGSMLVSLGWNLVNVVTYWIWHYCFFKWFKVGQTRKEDKLHERVVELTNEIDALRRHISDLDNVVLNGVDKTE